MYLEKLYKEKIIFDFIKFYNLNIYNIPKIKKVILSVGCGDFFFDKKKMNFVFNDLSLISNQKPIFIKSKRSISSFKIKKDSFIGLKVTLRNSNMYNFLFKLVKLILPRIKDFDGFSIHSFDKYGNYNFGLEDQSIFFELDEVDYDFSKGMNINIIINSYNIKYSLFLLKSFNFPFKN